MKKQIKEHWKIILSIFIILCIYISMVDACVPNNDFKTGDTDTYLGFTTNQYDLYAGGSHVMSATSLLTTFYDATKFSQQVNFSGDIILKSDSVFFRGGDGIKYWNNPTPSLRVVSGDDWELDGSGDFIIGMDAYADDYLTNSPTLNYPQSKKALDYFTTTSEERTSLDGSYNHSNVDDELILKVNIKEECEEILNKTTGNYYTGNCVNVTILSKSLGLSDELQRDAMKELKDENSLLKDAICIIDNCKNKFHWCGCPVF